VFGNLCVTVPKRLVTLACAQPFKTSLKVFTCGFLEYSDRTLSGRHCLCVFCLHSFFFAEQSKELAVEVKSKHFVTFFIKIEPNVRFIH